MIWKVIWSGILGFDCIYKSTIIELIIICILNLVYADDNQLVHKTPKQCNTEVTYTTSSSIFNVYKNQYSKTPLA